MDSRNSRKVLGAVFFTVFLDLVGFGILIPIQPFYAETLGASAATVTLLGASFSLMQFLFAPFWGKISDRIGRRPVMLISIAVASVGYLAFALSKSLPLLFASRMLAGFGTANIGTAQAIIADITAPEQRAKGMGMIGAAFGLGFIFGPAIGGAFGQFGLTTPLFIAASLSAVNWFFAFFMLAETHPNPGTPAGTHHGFSLANIKRFGSSKKVALLLVVFFTYTMAFSMMEQVLGLFIEYYWASGNVAGQDHARYSARLTTFVLVVVGITATIVQGGLIGRLAKKFGESKLLLAGTALVALSFILIPVCGSVGSFGVLVAVSALLAFGSGLTTPSLSSLLSRSVDGGLQGEAMGTGQSLSSLGRVIGPSIAGFLFQTVPGLPFWIGSVLLLGCAGIASRFVAKSST